MIDDWRYVSLVMDRLLMYVYMIVTVIATCSILIRGGFASFDQAAFKEEVSRERECKDDAPYVEKCHDWYSEICVDENNQLHPFIAANPGWYIGDACRKYINVITA